jgi:NCS1 family nucleobase:cation symporter-1
MPFNSTPTFSGYIFTWLIGYSALLGPVTGIMIADYYVVRGRTLSLDGLYQHGARSPYWYVEGFNPAAAFAFALGVLPNVPGFLRAAGAVTWCAPWAAAVYDYAWFVGFGIAFVVYVAMMRSTRRDRLREAKRLRGTS